MPDGPIQINFNVIKPNLNAGPRRDRLQRFLELPSWCNCTLILMIRASYSKLIYYQFLR